MIKRTILSVGVVALVGVGIVVWFDSPAREVALNTPQAQTEVLNDIRTQGPSLGTLRHRDQDYDLRGLISSQVRAESDDPFVLEFDADTMSAGCEPLDRTERVKPQTWRPVQRP